MLCMRDAEQTAGRSIERDDIVCVLVEDTLRNDGSTVRRDVIFRSPTGEMSGEFDYTCSSGKTQITISDVSVRRSSVFQIVRRMALHRSVLFTGPEYRERRVIDVD